MRMLPSRSIKADPLLFKKQVAKVKHISAPLKGLNLSTKMSDTDKLTAPILDNWIIEEDKIKCRAGTKLIRTHLAGAPVECLVPYYGDLNRLAIATNHELMDLFSGSVIKAGFTSNDWHWTAFSNLSAKEYTILVNGTDGVWSWDGGTTSIAPVVVGPTGVSISKSAAGGPAVITVPSGDISKFSNGMVVWIAGGSGVGMTNANGAHLIAAVGSPVNTFSLPDVDTSAASAAQTTGVTVEVPGTGAVKEHVTAPTYATHIQPDQFAIVCSHMNRLWFADNGNLSIYYLPLQQKAGEVKEIPLNVVFRRGGSIRAMYTWTMDGGAGMEDKLVIFSSNGECVIYSGVDPATDFQLDGVFRFDSPMSKHSVVNYGGDLYCLISTGLVPLSTLLRAETETLGQADRTVFSEFFKTSFSFRGRPGWSLLLNHSSGRMICNMPLGAANKYKQAVRFMPAPLWATWSNLPSRCWAWIDHRVFFGSDNGKVFEINPLNLRDIDPLTDRPMPIKVDVQSAWSTYGSPVTKQFKMVLPYIFTDGNPQVKIDFRVDYNDAVPTNLPDVTTFDVSGAVWDVTAWDADFWAEKPRLRNNWQGVAALGHVGAPRLQAMVLNCEFYLTGFDVLYEDGSVFG